MKLSEDQLQAGRFCCYTAQEFKQLQSWGGWSLPPKRSGGKQTVALAWRVHQSVVLTEKIIAHNGEMAFQFLQLVDFFLQRKRQNAYEMLLLFYVIISFCLSPAAVIITLCHSILGLKTRWKVWLGMYKQSSFRASSTALKKRVSPNIIFGHQEEKNESWFEAQLLDTLVVSK